MALSWSGIDLGRRVEFESRREVYREREKGWATRGDRFRATVLIVGVDGDDKAISPENAKIEIKLRYECDLIETKD